MKTKELKNIARKIAQQEQKIAEATDADMKKRAEQEVMRLCGLVKSIEDMMVLDDLVQDFLNS